MDALISGRAGHAVVFFDGRVALVRADASKDVEPRNWVELPQLLRKARDLELAVNVTHDEIARRLGDARHRMLALELMLTIQDRMLPHLVRHNAACELEELLLREEVSDLLNDVLYSSPLPREADLEGALEICERVGAVAAKVICSSLQSRQEQIVEVSRSWEAVPVIEFGGVEEFQQWRAAAVRAGLFRSFVESAFREEDPGVIRGRLVEIGDEVGLPCVGAVVGHWVRALEDGRRAVVDEFRPQVRRAHSADVVAEQAVPYDADSVFRQPVHDLRLYRIRYEECMFRLDATMRRAIEDGRDPVAQMQSGLSGTELRRSRSYFRGLKSAEEEDRESAILDISVGVFSTGGYESIRGSESLESVRAARSFIDDFGISDPREIDLEAIAMSRNVLVFDSYLKGCEARLVRVRDGGVIRLRNGIYPEGRRRFALAHELGHWELHAAESQGHFCSEVDIREYIGSDLEVEANRFAAELLMPTRLFRPYCEGVDPDIALVKELAAIFRSSNTAAAVRFVEECNEYCVVVFSVHGEVQWWRDALGGRGVDHRKFWLTRRQELREGTGAWECLQGKVSSGPMREVDPSLWLSFSADVSSISVREQSVRLGSHPIIMTLLWVCGPTDSLLRGE